VKSEGCNVKSEGCNVNSEKLEDIEISLFLDGIHQRYGFDFRDYSDASLKRRIWKCVHSEGLQTITRLLDRVLHDPVCMERFLMTVSVDTTSMFRDPDFYRAFRQKVVPLLRNLPLIRIWHAGCASGEEVYSMAILMQEEGLYDKCRIYATDMSEVILEKAKSGIFPLRFMQEYTGNYLKAGSLGGSFSEYYTASHEHVLFKPSLKKNIVFAQHNLVTDGSFNEFQVIICRNVMIYFNKKLQDRVHRLFFDSLSLSGFIGLGKSETIRFTPCEESYEVLDAEQKLYRKVR